MTQTREEQADAIARDLVPPCDDSTPTLEVWRTFIRRNIARDTAFVALVNGGSYEDARATALRALSALPQGKP